MKRISIFLCTLSLLFSIAACGNAKQNNTAEVQGDTPQSENSTASAALTQSAEKISDADPPDQSKSDPAQTQPPQTDTPSQFYEKEELEHMMNIQIGENLLTATLEQNSSAEALLEMLSDGPITIRMSDYAHMEKVGTLPASLPRNDESIHTDACDLILYQGHSFVIYYDTNSWSLTRLGKINNITKSELKSILGTGDITVVLSLPSE